jgi:AcrR family transcriptional regulator
MGAAAERLGVTPMALYRHVANKADLLDGVVELLLTEFQPPPSELPWPERLATLAGNIRGIGPSPSECLPAPPTASSHHG